MFVLSELLGLLVGISLQTGRLNISQTLQGWSCSSACSPSQHCRLPRCTNVVFPKTFSGSGTVSTSSGSGAFRSTIQHHQAVMEGLRSNNTEKMSEMSFHSIKFIFDRSLDRLDFILHFSPREIRFLFYLCSPPSYLQLQIPRIRKGDQKTN